MDSTFYDKLAEDLTTDEGLRLKPYRDTMGLLTIGVGRCLDTQGISKEEALWLLDADMLNAVRGCEQAFPWFAKLSEGRQRALANMAFNLGLPKLQGFRHMLRAFALKDYETAAKEALSSQWAQQVGARADRIAKLIREG